MIELKVFIDWVLTFAKLMPIFKLTLLITILIPDTYAAPNSELSESENEIVLYMDPTTGAIYGKPAKNRIRLGRYVKKSDQNDDKQRPQETILKPVKVKSEQKNRNWYDRFSIRGYTQIRSSELFSDPSTPWFHPADRSVSEDQSLILRRSRLVLSGDVSKNLFVFIQPDLSTSVSGGDLAFQVRDLYGDYFLDPKRESSIRFGLSVIPYGFSNLQSSRNRAPLERAEGINSSLERERDLGAIFYWGPRSIRDRFLELSNDKDKGSGDFGLFALGAYTGQGLNRGERNDDLHVVSRLAYPFKFTDRQIFETSISGFFGNFVPSVEEIGSNENNLLLPTFNPEGIKDQRLALSAVLYPRPFGFEAEWNLGQGPALSDDYGSIESKSLKGGYLMLNYLNSYGKDLHWLPFVRWQYYQGGRKLALNAPFIDLEEWDFGVEWRFANELELTLDYAYSNNRTNSLVYPYSQIRDAHRLGVQLQFLY